MPKVSISDEPAPQHHRRSTRATTTKGNVAPQSETPIQPQIHKQEMKHSTKLHDEKSCICCSIVIGRDEKNWPTMIRKVGPFIAMTAVQKFEPSTRKNLVKPTQELVPGTTSTTKTATPMIEDTLDLNALFGG